MFDFKDKVVLITGAAKGIGAAISEETLIEGAKHVRILDIDEDAGIDLQIKLNNQYGSNKAKFVKCDVRKEDQLFSAFEDTKKEQGYLDVVINNAGVINEFNYAAMRNVVEINFMAVINGTAKAIELMDKNKGGRGGAIINVSSIAGLYPICPPTFIYSSTKAAVLQFTSCIGMEYPYTSTGIRVIAVCFGGTESNIFGDLRTFQGVGDQRMAEIIPLYPLQRTESAAQGVVEAYKQGDSASIWLIHENKPAINITEEREKCHQIMANLLRP
ncbi:15-hydroxyprostaglandin dehydrogenase [NAD(+)]-like [Anticarsia gemmatalis]|uniref:15-hydroxyprostaglandin dehydrogenase [NAD(+)]-like n=1 Tax=Anticarsia gemmatalis TaxID=129554 RepID=UPI003F7753B0